MEGFVHGQLAPPRRCGRPSDGGEEVHPGEYGDRAEGVPELMVRALQPELREHGLAPGHDLLRPDVGHGGRSIQRQAVARSAKEIEDARRTLERAKDAVDDTYRRLIDEELGWAWAFQDAEAVLEDRAATLAALQADPPSDPQATLDAEAAISDARNALAEASLAEAREAANERLDEEESTTARAALAAVEVAHAHRPHRANAGFPGTDVVVGTLVAMVPDGRARVRDRLVARHQLRAARTCLRGGAAR
jgi:hypothetical protein